VTVKFYDTRLCGPCCLAGRIRTGHTPSQSLSTFHCSKTPVNSHFTKSSEVTKTISGNVSLSKHRLMPFTASTTATVLRPFSRDHQGEPVPEENFWTLWCKERLTETETPTIRLGATPSGLTSAHLHHSPHFFTGRMPFLPPNQQCQSTEGTHYAIHCLSC